MGYPPPSGGWQPGQVPLLELRPGIIPLRPLGLGDVYAAAMKTIRGNVAATIGLAFVTTLILTVPSTALGAWLNSLAVDPTDPYASTTSALGPVGSAIPSVVIAFGSIILTGFMAYVVGQGVLGRRVGAGETWAGSRGRLLRVIGAAILTGLAELLVVAAFVAIPVVLLVTADSNSSTATAVLLIVAAVLAALVVLVVLWTRFAFPTAAIVLEKVGVFSGIARSWRLTSGGQFWRILGIRLLTAIIVGVAGEILTVPISMIAYATTFFTGNESSLLVVQAVIAGVTGLLTGAITTPFTAAVDAILYIDQRIRREGLDVRLIAAAQSAAQPPWDAAARR